MPITPVLESLELRILLAQATSFEFTDTSGEFTLFESPEQATFAGGEAKTIGVPALYRTGVNSWMIDANNTGMISLETPAQTLTLYLRDQEGDVQSELTAFDTDDNVIGMINGVTTGFTEFRFSRASGQLPLARIEITNNSSTAGTYAAVDDFSFSIDPPVGEPLDDPIPEGIPASSFNMTLTPVAEGLIAPNWGTVAPGISGRLFVTDQPGMVYSIDLATGDKSVFLDVSDRLVNLNAFDERGLLGLAFDPDFATSGLLYTYTSEPDSGTADFTFPGSSAPNHQSVVTEWHVIDPTDPDAVVDPDSARELLRIDQPQGNHNAGGLSFGPNGNLHISLGDGGAGDDQGNGHSAGGNGQDPTNVFGSILQIDPQGTNSANGQYGIPAGNPFVGNMDGIPEEIFMFGLRNPFRFSFDSDTGEQIIADVGQNDIEEVNLIDPVADAGANFGWKFKEGTFFFNDNGGGPGFVTDVDPGNLPLGLIDPVLQYDHDEGNAVVGGFVYRGSAHPALTGQYIFGDYSGRVFLGDLDAETFEELTPDGFGLRILGFGQDAKGEVYVLTNETGGPRPDSQGEGTGVVYRVDLVSEGVVIIDNGDAGYATTSGWTLIPDATFPTPEGRGGDMENSGMGTGADVATWTFSGLTAGAYRVSATWSTHPNRATNAPYSIFDGAAGALLGRALVNQEQEPDDFNDDGSAWEDLGIVTITGDMLTVQLSDAADQFVIADAVRIEQFPTVPPAGPLFKDDGDVSYSDSGWNVSPVLEGRLNDIRYQFKGTGSETATWTFTGLTPGNYTVAATWSAHPNRASNAPYTILDGAGGDTLEIMRLNQKQAPDDFFDNGGLWEHIAVVTISGTELVVELTNDVDGFVIADAIRIAPTSEAPLPAGTIIDDGDAGFTTTVGWNLTPVTEGRDGDIQFAGAGNGSRIATWTFNGLTAGTYRVSATWSTHVNRAADAPYSVFDGATPLGTVEVDQQVAPDDFSTLGSDWKDLMEVTITGDTLVVQLSNAANGFVIADAVRVQSLT